MLSKLDINLGSKVKSSSCILLLNSEPVADLTNEKILKPFLDKPYIRILGESNIIVVIGII